MKIAFLGFKSFFDYYQIGGFESCIRRISLVLAEEGVEIDYLIYGAKMRSEIKIKPNFTLKYFVKFDDIIKETTI